MKYLLLLLVPFVFSCQEEEKELPKLLSYTEKLFLQENLSLNLPQINNGEYFFEEDSTFYLNVFILNDSTIKFNDSAYNLPIGRSEGYFMMRNVGGDSVKDFNPKVIAESIDSFIKVNLANNTALEFNLFFDSSMSFKTLSAFYHYIFMQSLNDVNAINLFGANNDFVSVNYSKSEERILVCGMGRYRGIFEILINMKGQLMIENEWDLSFKDLKTKVIEYYTNPNNDEDLPELVEVNKSVCLQQIAILKKRIEQGDSNKLVKLYKWEKKLLNVKVLGAYKTLPRRSFIFIQLDKSSSYSSYLSVVDSIARGVMELKNNLCIYKFGREYKNLNTNLYIDYLIKQAIDNVYPNKINAEIYYPPIEIKPPPPPPRRRK